MAKRKRDDGDKAPKRSAREAPRRVPEPHLTKEVRKALARRLRERLRETPMGVAEITAALEIEPEVVVIALRELRARKRGRLRSTIKLGHVHWWWEDAKPEGKTERESEKPKKKR